MSNLNRFSFQTHNRWRSNRLVTLLKLLAIVNLLAHGARAKLNPCDVETGQANIILDIEESRGDCKYRFRCVHPISRSSDPSLIK